MAEKLVEKCPNLEKVVLKNIFFRKWLEIKNFDIINGVEIYYSLAPISFYGQISREHRLCPLTSAKFSKNSRICTSKTPSPIVYQTVQGRHVTSYERIRMGCMHCEPDCILPVYKNFILASRCSSALVDRSKLLPRRVSSFPCYFPRFVRPWFRDYKR